MRYLLLLIPVLFFGCKENDDDAVTQFSLKLTDAPALYEEVNIDILTAEVHLNDGSEWNPLTTKTGVYNLIDLANGNDTLIASADLSSAATISQIRLKLGSNNTVKVNGQVFPLKVPSGMQSGLKLNVHEKLEGHYSYILVMDFDANKSVVDKGNGEYQLKPVIRTYVEAITGAIKGVADPATSLPTVYAITGTDSISTIANSTTGFFMITGLAPGTYDVYLDPVSPFSPVTVPNVGVTAGVTSDIDTVQVQ